MNSKNRNLVDSLGPLELNRISSSTFGSYMAADVSDSFVKNTRQTILLSRDWKLLT